MIPPFPLLFHHNPASQTAVISIPDTGSFLGLSVVLIQSSFDTNSSSQILGEYLRSLSRVRGTIHTSNE